MKFYYKLMQKLTDFMVKRYAASKYSYSEESYSDEAVRKLYKHQKLLVEDVFESLEEQIKKYTISDFTGVKAIRKSEFHIAVKGLRKEAVQAVDELIIVRNMKDFEQYKNIVSKSNKEL